MTVALRVLHAKRASVRRTAPVASRPMPAPCSSRRLSTVAHHVQAGHAIASAPAAASSEEPALPPPPVEMSERDKFMLDMNGYLVIPGFLTEQEVSSLNASFDANWERRVRGAENAAGKRRGFDQFHGMLSWPLPHSQPFRDLLAHPKLVVSSLAPTPKLLRAVPVLTGATRSRI